MQRERRHAGIRNLIQIPKNTFHRPILLEKVPSSDRLLLIAVLLLAGFGSLMVFSAGYAYAEVRYQDPTYFIRKQAIFLLAGIAVMILASRVRPQIYEALTPVFYLVTLVLLLLVLFIGFVGNGAQRWISIGPVTIQPSEIAKMTMVMMLARYFSVYGEKAVFSRTKKESFLFGTIFPILIMLIPILLVMLQKHLSCIIILGLLGLSVILAAGVDARYIAGFTGAGVIGVACLAIFTDYTKERITVWLDPSAYRLEGGWQTLQGLMAIGSGGLFGVGFGKSLLKYCYVSEPANDMIFAILCEELGFFGAAFTLALFVLLIVRGFLLALRAKNVFCRLVTFGVTAKIAIQVLLNVAVVTNTIPNTGISLPFFSYGGSSLIMLFFEIGMLLSFSRYAGIEK